MIDRDRIKKKETNEEMEDYLGELVEAKMEQAEIRFKASRYWVFETEESDMPED
jgi:hypothetical protein